MGIWEGENLCVESDSSVLEIVEGTLEGNDQSWNLAVATSELKKIVRNRESGIRILNRGIARWIDCIYYKGKDNERKNDVIVR